MIINERPFAFFAFFFMVGIALSYYAHLPENAALIVLCISAGVFLFSFIFRWERAFFAVYIAGAALGAFLFQTQFTAPPHLPVGKDAQIEGTVSFRSKMNNQTHNYTLKNVVIRTESETVSLDKDILLYTPQRLEYGDIAVFDAVVELPQTPRNPGAFDQKMYLAANNAVMSFYQTEVSVEGRQLVWTEFPFLIREDLADHMDLIFSEQSAPVAKAMFLGVKDEIPDETRESFAKTGIAHILAISGLHISILSALINYLMKKMRVDRRIRFTSLIAALLLYMMITGFALSIVRAVVMTIFVVAGRWLFRRRDTLTFLSGALVFTLLLNTAQLFTAGFLMSYGVVFGILCLTPPLGRFFRRLRLHRTVGGSLSASLSATASVFPLTAYYFHNVALAAPVANFFAIPLAAVIVAFSAFGALVSLFSAAAGTVVAFPAEWAIRILTAVNEWMAQTNFGYIPIRNFPLGMCFAVPAVLFILSDYVFLSRRAKGAVAAVFALCAVGFAAFRPRPAATVTVLDVGTGDAVHIQIGDRDYLLDNGGNMQYSNVLRYARDNDIQFDAAIITNTKTKNLQGLITEDRIGKLYVPGSYEPKEYDSSVPNSAYTDDAVIPLGEGFALETAAADDKYTSFVLTKDGNNLFLFAQNSVDEFEEDIKDVRVLKVADGGKEGSVSKDWLSSVNPDYTVISVKNGNQRGLPDPVVMKLLDESGTETVLTAESGAVIFTVSGDGMIEQKVMIDAG